METQNNSNQTQNANMKPCASCGNMVSKNAKACPNCGAKIKKPIYKRVWFILLIIVAVIVIIAFAASGGEGSDSGNQPTSSNSGAVVNDSGNSNLGQSKVEIKSCKLTKDFEGNPAAVVTYSYTNNGKEAQAFDFAFITHAYQNGVEAEKCYVISDDGNYDSNNNQSKEIKPGVTIDVMVAYKLNDTTSPVEVEVGQFLSFDNTKITKTFNF